MNLKFAAAVAAIGLVVVATPVVAHHSFAAEYDANKRVTVKGIVTRIELRNPHSHVYIDVKDDKGNVTNLNFELGPPLALLISGWRTNCLNVGDEVTIDGAMAKDGSNRANARMVTLPDGRRVSAGSSGGDFSSK
jgi:DNA/RNA endonuclease YhcR with UshA esterase domain